MPTYDYTCIACGETVEIFQKITDDPIRKCPSCKKLKLERQFGTGAAIVFKGSGFYQTDYRSDSYKKGADSDSKSDKSNGDSKASETKSESKTTPPADSKPASDPKPPKNKKE